MGRLSASTVNRDPFQSRVKNGRLHRCVGAMARNRLLNLPNDFRVPDREIFSLRDILSQVIEFRRRQRFPALRLPEQVQFVVPVTVGAKLAFTIKRQLKALSGFTAQ